VYAGRVYESPASPLCGACVWRRARGSHEGRARSTGEGQREDQGQSGGGGAVSMSGRVRHRWHTRRQYPANEWHAASLGPPSPPPLPGPCSAAASTLAAAAAAAAAAAVACAPPPPADPARSVLISQRDSANHQLSVQIPPRCLRCARETATAPTHARSASLGLDP